VNARVAGQVKQGFTYRLEYTNLIGVFGGGSRQEQTMRLDNDSTFIISKVFVRWIDDDDVNIIPASLSFSNANFLVTYSDNISGSSPFATTNPDLVVNRNCVLGVFGNGAGVYPFRQNIPAVLSTPIKMMPNSSVTVGVEAVSTNDFNKVFVDFIGTKHFLR
jgi:hypothetical protein